MREAYVLKLASGTELELRYTFKSLRFIEKATGGRFFGDIGQGRIGADYIAASLAAGLQHKDKSMTTERAENLLEAHLDAGGALPDVLDGIVDAFKRAGILKRDEGEAPASADERPPTEAGQ